MRRETADCQQAMGESCRGRGTGREELMELHLHDRVELKKPHPCGAVQWEVLRVGMDIKLKCLGCGHELMLPRSKAEKSIRRILTEEGHHE
jgi:hypothetical protein